MMSDENAKIKQQKAEIRCDYLRANRELIAVKVGYFLILRTKKSFYFRENWNS
jgi:hypothetical protein